MGLVPASEVSLEVGTVPSAGFPVVMDILIPDPVRDVHLEANSQSGDKRLVQFLSLFELLERRLIRPQQKSPASYHRDDRLELFGGQSEFRFLRWGADH